MRVEELISRRAALHAVAPLLLVASTRLPATALDNRLPKDELELKYKSPRTPGPKPTDIGIQGSSDNALKPCTDGKPHCFSSSPDNSDDEDANSAGSSFAEWIVEPFLYDKPLAEAFKELKDTIAVYPPGQRGIDGGGFKLIADNIKGETAYVYVQYESRRKGYVDDMEFALSHGRCNVRTSSRLGYLDRGVNAKRYAWFSDTLGAAKGWKTTPLRAKGHDEYFALNSLSDNDLIQK